MGLGYKIISTVISLDEDSTHLHLNVRPDVDSGTFPAALFFLSCLEPPSPSQKKA